MRLDTSVDALLAGWLFFISCLLYRGVKELTRALYAQISDFRFQIYYGYRISSYNILKELNRALYAPNRSLPTKSRKMNNLWCNILFLCLLCATVASGNRRLSDRAEHSAQGTNVMNTMKKKDKMFSNVDTLVKESKQNEEREDQQEEKMENFEKSTDKRLRVVEARAVIPGPPGRDGRDGNRGEPGHRGRDGRDGLAGEVGTPGKTGRPGTPGKRGPEGKQGPKGDDGVGLTLKSFQIGASYNRGDYVFMTPSMRSKHESMYIAQKNFKAKSIPEVELALGHWEKFEAPRGPPGERGGDGADGKPGEPGAPGRGDRGERGPPGATGDTGEPGPRGPTGGSGIDVEIPDTPAGPDVGSKIPHGTNEYSILDPSSRTGSDQYPHANCKHGKISDTHGWCSHKNAKNTYYQLDLKNVQTILGVATKGRADAQQWLTSFTVSVSANGDSWDSVDNGYKFTGNSDVYKLKNSFFSKSVTCRYVRIEMAGFNSHVSLRAAIIFPRSKAGSIYSGYQTLENSALAILDPPTNDRQSSGDHNHASCKHGMLSDSHGWCAASSQNGHWYVADLGSPLPVQGIATKGRGDASQWVTKYSVFVSKDKENWFAVDGGKLFTGNKDNSRLMVNRFSEILNARYVKVQISNWKSHMSFRMGVVVAKSQTKGVVTNARTDATKLVVMDPDSGHDSVPTYPHANCKHGMLSDSHGWCAAKGSNNQGAWKQVDMGHVTDIFGFATKGRADADQYGTVFTAFASVDGDTWYAADFGTEYRGNRDSSSIKLNPFYNKVRARYLRVQVVSFKSHLSLRLGVLVSRSSKPASSIFTNKKTLENSALAILDPPTNDRQSSGDHNHASCKHGMLSDSHGWCAASSQNGHWYVADLGSPLPVQGIATKGRGDASQWVTKYSVFVSKDKENWFAVDGGKLFTGNKDNSRLMVNRFSEILNARYVKVQISNWKSHMSFRMGVVVAKSQTTIFSDKKPTNYKVNDLSLQSRSASSTYNHPNCKKGMLSKPNGWCAATSQNGVWYEMDMGKVRPLGGVRTKGRGDANQWVTAFQAFVSVDHKSWYAVENGKEYNGNHDNKHNQDTVFARILNARYVRLQISSWHSHLSMRAAPLIEN